ncbi:MAG: NAD-dependent malic enzyme [Trueperaceae bacterium]|nr:MAG: NAD-dependent malic enzyme [Trueperaceae bacterium]
MKQYKRRIDADGQEYLEVDLSPLALTRLPLLNKSTAFTLEERRELGLIGLFPSHVSTIEEQITRSYANFENFSTNLDKHVFLRVLQDRNEVLFYALLEAHLEEMMPIIYTPTVAEAVEKFSIIYRYARGLVVSTENIDHIDEILANTPFPEVSLIVATDSEGILGIGDQGFGGMAICIGKLSLYTAAAGIDPALTLPVELDVGTNRQDLLDDPLYLGVRHERLTGQAYEDFIHRFVTALEKRFPDVLLQWEDFSKQKAFDVLERYRSTVPSFNDDIQGTGSVVLGGLLNAARKSRQPLKDQVFLIHGAGAGGIGVAHQIALGLVREGLSYDRAKDHIFLIDSKGLVLSDRVGLESYKHSFAHDPARVATWQIDGRVPSLLETVREGGVTALIGLSGQRGAFSQEVVEAVDANTPYPIVFPLSNPTANSEAIPEDIFRWTEGRAIVATGSPFDEVTYNGVNYPIGQGNNAFIFPGLGLGVMLSGARRVTDGMLTAAALALSEYTDANRVAQGGMYPRIEHIRGVSRRVAAAVMAQALEDGVASVTTDEDLNDFVEKRMWKPRYLPFRRKR